MGSDLRCCRELRVLLWSWWLYLVLQCLSGLTPVCITYFSELVLATIFRTLPWGSWNQILTERASSLPQVGLTPRLNFTPEHTSGAAKR